MKVKKWEKLINFVKIGDTVKVRGNKWIPAALQENQKYKIKAIRNFKGFNGHPGFLIIVESADKISSFDPRYFSDYYPKHKFSEKTLKVLFGD